MAYGELGAFYFHALHGLGFFLEDVHESAGKFFADLRQCNAILRPARTGQTGFDAREIQMQRIGEGGLWRFPAVEEPLCLRIFLDQCDARSRPPGRFQEAQRFIVDRKEAAGGAIFRRHVADGGAVFERHVGQALAIIFDKLPDHAFLAQHLRDCEHEIGRGDARAQLPRKAHADDFGNQHGDRLPEHGGFGLDATYPPAQHREAVDHRGVGVGSDQRVGIGIFNGRLAFLDLVRPNGLREIFQVHLMANAGPRRHDAKAVESLRAPAQE